MMTKQNTFNQHEEMRQTQRVLEMTMKRVHEQGRQVIRKKNTVRRFALTFAGAAAALIVAFTGSVNVSAAFASAVDDIPVIGAVARFVNIRTYIENKAVSEEEMQNIIDELGHQRNGFTDTDSVSTTVVMPSDTGAFVTSEYLGDQDAFDKAMDNHTATMEKIKEGAAVTTATENLISP